MCKKTFLILWLNRLSKIKKTQNYNANQNNFVSDPHSWHAIRSCDFSVFKGVCQY